MIRLTGLALSMAAFTGACGPTTEPRSVEQPTLETVGEKPRERGTGSFGADAPEGFLRPCTTLSVDNGLVELACNEYQVVEFRKLREAARPGGEVPEPEGIDALMEILQARFGPLSQVQRSEVIDSQPIEVSDFEPEAASETKAHGVAVRIPNTEGHFWGLACYRKDGQKANREFCADAIATAARAGGLSHVGATPMQDFGDGVLVTPEGCQKVPGRKIHCPETGELSWSVGDAAKRRELTLQSLETTAKTENVKFGSQTRACTLFGKKADCTTVQILDPKEGAEMNFILLVGGEQERLVVCTVPRELSNPLPKPCDQAIELAASQ